MNQNNYFSYFKIKNRTFTSIALIATLGTLTLFAQSNPRNKLGSAPISRKPNSITSSPSNSRSIQLDLSNRQVVAQFYKSDYIPYDKIANNWTGNTKSCSIGNNSKEYDEATLQNLKFYRAMAGVPSDVSFDEKYNKPARAAALIMEAKNDLSHNPPVTWPCYSKEGKQGASSSNLCLGCVGPNAIDAYVSDSGVQGVGHRVWALHPGQKVFGTGSSNRAHALYVFGDWRKGEEVSNIKAVSWPPKGFVPYKFGYNPNYPWSYQAFGSATNHKDAQVKMSIDGKSISLRKESGNSGILVWYPKGLPNPSKSNDYNKLTKDISIDVEISNLKINGKSENVKYKVIFINPDLELDSSTTSNNPSGNNTVVVENNPSSDNTSNNLTSFNSEMSKELLSAAYDGNAKKVEETLYKGADPNTKHQGWTALMYAAYFGHTDIVLILLKYKADPNIELDGWNAASLASYQKHYEIVKLIQSQTGKRSIGSVKKSRSILKIKVPTP